MVGTVEADRALSYLNELLWTAMVLSAPLLVGTLLVGLVISIFQVVTQIQEATLSYVPKLLAAAVILFLLGGWMLGRLSAFATSLYQSIPGLVG